MVVEEVTTTSSDSNGRDKVEKEVVVVEIKVDGQYCSW